MNEYFSLFRYLSLKVFLKISATSTGFFTVDHHISGVQPTEIRPSPIVTVNAHIPASLKWKNTT